MEFSFRAEVLMTLQHNQGDATSKHVATEFNLETIGLDQSRYQENGLPNKDGCHVLTATLVQGLVGCIHHANDKGYRDSAEHLRYIISELEKGFSSVAELSNSNFSK